MKKETQSDILMKKYIKFLIFYGLLAILISTLFIVYKVGSTKTNMAENYLNAYLNKDIASSDKTYYYKYGSNDKFDCSTRLSFSNGLNNVTECSLKEAYVAFLNGSSEDKVIETKDLTLSIQTNLFVSKITDILNSGFEFKLKSEGFSVGDIFLLRGLNIPVDTLSEENKVVLNKDLLGQFKNIKLSGVGTVTKPSKMSDIFNVNLAGDFYSKDWAFSQNVNFKFVRYDVPKVIKFKDSVSEEDSDIAPAGSTTSSKLVLPYEIFVNNNNSAYAALNSRNDLLNVFYNFYKVIYDSKLDKEKYNDFYLNIQEKELVSFDRFVESLADLTSKAATQYKGSTKAPIMEAIKSLFNGANGSCYKISVKDPMKNISLAYLMELTKKDPLTGANLNEELYNRTVLECKGSLEDCFKQCR